MHARKIVVAALTLSLTHCYSTYDLEPRAVAGLDGFREGSERKIVGTDGALTFSRDTELRFDLPEPISGRFSSIAVRDSIFEGVERKSHTPVVVDLARVGHVTATNFSVSKTAALAIVASILGTIAIGVLALWIGVATTTGPLL